MAKEPPLAVRAGRRVVEVSRPGKPLFPCGITKADVARYYATVAPAMLPHLERRPLNLERFPDGIEGHRIVQQHAAKHFPDWLARVEVEKRGGTVEHVVATEAAALVYLAGQGCLTLHPWLSRTDRLDRPDRLIVDLDPSDDGTPADAARAAREAGALLRELGLDPLVMATGSRGYHVIVLLQRREPFDAVRAFARDVARAAAERAPDRLTVEQRKAKREGRIYVDVQRNAYAQTAVAPYAVRPRRGAPVATPLAWEELDDPDIRPDAWTLHTLPERLARGPDPWAGARPQALGAARRRLGALGYG